MGDFKKNSEENYIEIIQRLVKCIVIMLVIIVALVVINIMDLSSPKKKKPTPIEYVPPTADTTLIVQDTSYIKALDTSLIRNEKNAAQIIYGRNLIINTAFYYGPKGKLAQQANGMNCQNCHMEAGSKPFGNNYLGVASTYPKFSDRSGTTENIYKRVNDCFERSLNGKALDTLSEEMKAIEAYIMWLGKDIPKGLKPKGSGVPDLKFMDRAADPEKGKNIYTLKCKSCHNANGEGKLNADGVGFQYPPLWGDNSYSNRSEFYRLSCFAGYVKYNMPQGASSKNIQLTDEEVWDVAAFVNSQPRPKKDLSKDWPNIAGKPFDHPFGPYADTFSEEQHKYGPFAPIRKVKK